MDLSQYLLLLILALPALVFASFSLAWLLGFEPSERLVSRVTGASFAASVLAFVVLLANSGAARSPIVITFGNWFAVHAYHFPLVLLADRLSLPFVGLTIVLAGLVGKFSATYLHRDRGFLRFFLLLHLFAFGSLLAFLAGSFELLLAGWEFVGITSVLLIAFFHQRPAPVENAIRVFAVYRATDIGLLLAVFFLHHWSGTASFAGHFPSLAAGQGTAVCLLLLLAAAGKSAQVPFSGWLPRAMEGPTPSSAIFYGAISIHAGAYLLLRAVPLLAVSPAARVLVIAIGLATAIHGTITGRAAADAKTSLAYASLTQVGVVFIEIGFGWTSVAIAHVLGHATIRTLQFLRAPSMLHDDHAMRSAVGGELSPAGAHLEDLFPERLRLWLYRWALDRGHLDTLLDRTAIYPLLRLSNFLARLDNFGADSPTPRRDASPSLPGLARQEAK